MSPGEAGSTAMETAGEPPPGKEPVMRVVRRAAVLILLGLSLGFPGASLAKARPEKTPPQTRGAALNALDLLNSLSHFLTRLGFKADCSIDPLGQCMASTPAPGAQTQNTEAGCGMDPLGACSPGH